mmetsp:Transcript_154002/g.295307  ORF Transcript_154002/g.295307 Transcript_154002/m.295307 type:complete len:212 (+) Transcript_154002:489-1124(+)
MSNLPNRGAVQTEEQRIADSHSAHRRETANTLLGVWRVLLLVKAGNTRCSNLFQCPNIKVLRDNITCKLSDLSHKLLASHLSIANATKKPLCLILLVVSHLRILCPMSVPAHQGLEKMDLLDAGLVSLKDFQQHCHIEMEKALCLHNLLRMHQDEGQVSLHKLFLLISPSQCEHRAGSFGGDGIRQMVANCIAKRTDAIVVRACHQWYHVL